MINRKVRNVLMTVYFIITGIIILVADQVSKYWVTRNIPINESKEVMPNFLYITHIINTGAAFGLFQNNAKPLAIVSVVAIILIIVLSAMLPLNSIFYNISLGFILGGALGNLVDRYFVGEVVDFIHFVFFPIFNIADSFIVIGFCLIIILIIREYLKKDETKEKGVEQKG